MTRAKSAAFGRPGGRRRSGAAAVEFVVMMLFMLPIFISTLEFGQLVRVNQLMTNAVREGCRLAAQGRTLAADGTLTNIRSGASDGTPPAEQTVRGAVFQSLVGASAGVTSGEGAGTRGRASSSATGYGLAWADVTCEFQFVPTPPPGVSPVNPKYPSATEPWQGVKGQRFRVRASIPWSKVSIFSYFGIAPVGPSTVVSAEAFWQILVDDPFVIDQSTP